MSLRTVMTGACLCLGVAAGVWVLLIVCTWYAVAYIEGKWKSITVMNFLLGTIFLGITIVIRWLNANPAHERPSCTCPWISSMMSWLQDQPPEAEIGDIEANRPAKKRNKPAQSRTLDEPGPSSPTSPRRTTLYNGQLAPAPAAASSVPEASHATRAAPTQRAVPALTVEEPQQPAKDKQKTRKLADPSLAQPKGKFSPRGQHGKAIANHALRPKSP